MITEKDLCEAIAECQGARKPDANTCIKLAAFYIIKNEMYGQQEETSPILPAYSYSAASEQVETTIDYYSDTEFSEAIDGRRAADIWPIIDELMSVLQATNPRLYAGVMRKINS